MLYTHLINQSYPTKKDLRNLIYYVLGEHCTTNIYGATGMLLSNPETMYQSMIQVKKQFNKTEGRQALHLIISFDKDDSEWLTPHLALEIGYQLALTMEGVQTVFGVHDNTDKLHIHMVLNSVNYITGLKIGISSQKVYCHINNQLNQILNQYRNTYNPTNVVLSIDDLLT